MGFCAYRSRQRRAAISKKRIGMKRIEVPEEIIKDAQPIDESVQKMADKLKLHRTQVKGILKALYEVPELLNTAKQQAGEITSKEEGGQCSESTTPEIRHTRNAAKKVVEEGGKVNWILEKINESDKTPEKKRGRKRKNPEVLFNAAEFPDEDDEEYDPTKDIADISDEESAASDTTGTPMSSSMISPAARVFERSLQTPNLDSNDFKKPQEIASSAVRALNFEVEQSRTLRSKNDLKDVTIEELEMQYNPPDITDDLYDDNLEHDDYAKFLAETYFQPITPKVADITAADDNEDPDFEYHEQDDDVENFEELKFNRSTKISQKEADELLNELFEDYDIDVKNRSKSKDVNKEEKGNEEVGNADKQDSHYSQYYHHYNYACQLNQEQRSIIAQQMRQHIQLLTQMSLLSSKDKHWEVLNNDCKHMLHELYNRSYSNAYSVYNQENLCPSLNLLEQWDNQLSTVPTVIKEYKGKPKHELSMDLVKFVGDHSSIAFPYPEMLPCSALKPSTPKMLENDKPYFAKAEDNLIVLGLETYFDGTDRWKKEGYAKAAAFVSKNLMRSKTAKHIRVRIKNRKDKCRIQSENAITYYHQHNAAPKIAEEDLQPYHPGTKTSILVRNSPNLPDFYRDVFKTEKGDVESPRSIGQSRNSSQVYQAIAPTTVRLPEVQFTITPQFDLIMLPNSEENNQESFSREIKACQSHSKTSMKTGKKTNLSSPVQKQKHLKTILPKEGSQTTTLPPETDKPFERTIEKESSTTMVVAPEPDMPSFASPHLTSETVEGNEASKVAEPTTSTTNSSIKAASPRKNIKASSRSETAELTLQLLEAEKPDEESIRKQHEALEISMNAQEQLSAEKFSEFCKIVVNDNLSNKQKFMELHTLCAGKMELQEMLLDLLTNAGEAHEISSDIYAQYCLRDAVKSFFRKVKVAFQDSNPLVYSKILKDFQLILGQSNVKTEEIISIGQKYFKNSPLLLDEFMTFAGNVPYPRGMLPDPEIIDLSDEEDEDKATFEEKINLLDDEDDLGGPNCPCACHPALLTGSNHCIHCSLKFINGKVYCRDGKMLKPVRVQYAKSLAKAGERGKKKQRKRK